MIGCEVGNKPPRMIPWKCVCVSTHNCNAEDGVESTNLSWLSLSRVGRMRCARCYCSTSTSLEASSAFRKDGLWRTKDPDRVDAKKLADVEQLEICRVHYNESRWLAQVKTLWTLFSLRLYWYAIATVSAMLQTQRACASTSRCVVCGNQLLPAGHDPPTIVTLMLCLSRLFS
jgi:hypothetical protein